MTPCPHNSRTNNFVLLLCHSTLLCSAPLSCRTQYGVAKIFRCTHSLAVLIKANVLFDKISKLIQHKVSSTYYMYSVPPRTTRTPPKTKNNYYTALRATGRYYHRPELELVVFCRRVSCGSPLLLLLAADQRKREEE